jgi:NAD/NADP transhydrogenase beta subunit
MPKSAKLGLATLMVGVAIAVTATVALAVKYGSEVTIDSLTTAGVSGTVSSNHAKCVNNRRVRVWMRAARGAPVTFVGSDRADSSGHWELNQTLVPGHYIARVHRRVFRRRPNRPRIVCLPDRTLAQQLTG